MTTEHLNRASAALGSVLANVTVEQHSLPTPCASWDVKALVNHAVGALHYFATAAEGADMPVGAEAPDFAADAMGAFTSGRDRVASAFSADGAMEKMMTLPFGTMPGAVVAGMASTDMFVHAWDLAKATGQSTNLDPDLAEQLLARSQQSIQDGFRGEDGKAPFGMKAEAGADATAADRLAAFLGRQV